MEMNAPRDIPEKLRLKYTMGGTIPVRQWWFDDSCRDVSKNYSASSVLDLRQKLYHRQDGYYGRTDFWMYDALEQFPIKGKSVLVFGSETPWYELMAQEFGARLVTVVEYNPRPYGEMGVKYVSPAVLGDEEFDCAFSVSSFEHDGLGRYGDPLNPCGDFRSMLQAKQNIVYGGLLFLSVPVGQDLLVWNAHRVYGSLRLSMLIQGWGFLSSFGFSGMDFYRDNSDVTTSGYHQPVFVLRN